MQYLILRLPDVIGPYDDSARFWKVVLQVLALLQFLKQDLEAGVEDFKFEFDEEEVNDKISFISSTDVSKILCMLVRAQRDTPEILNEICKQAYNFT